MAGRATKKVTEEQPKATTTKKTTSKKEVVDTTAVEVPVEVEKEPEIEASVNPNPNKEVFDEIVNRFPDISDTEATVASKIFETTKDQLKESFSEENGTLIAAAATDAALTVMESIAYEAERQKNIELLTAQYKERKEARERARDERKLQRDLRRLERSKDREARKARLGLAGKEV